MRTQKISFPKQRAFCVFPEERSELAQVVSELQLEGSYPVIVLIGGDIEEERANMTRCAIETLAGVAESVHAVVICGGTEMGVMAEIGTIRSRNHYRFPLVGIAPEELVAWPGGQRSTKFLWWGKKRWHLESHHSHFILVPGSQFGDESPWIVDTATTLCKGRESVTVLINGGAVSRKDIELSLENGRPVIVLSGTGRLADEFAGQPNRNKLMTIVPANAEKQIVEVVQAALAVTENSVMIWPSIRDKVATS